MADLADRCAAVVKRYGGTVDKFTGDGIMAVFGAPVALEDHAVRACLAALGVQEEVKRVFSFVSVDLRAGNCSASDAGDSATATAKAVVAVGPLCPAARWHRRGSDERPPRLRGDTAGAECLVVTRATSKR